MRSGSTRELARSALGDVAIGEVVTVRGRELPAQATVADARRLFASSSVQVLPLLDADGRYRAAIAREALDEQALADDAPLLPLASPELLPTAPATLAAEAALRQMDEIGAKRLVVLGEDGSYAGLVCLRGDRERLCVDAECHLLDDAVV